MTSFKTYTFPPTRIATMDVSEMGKKKHNIAALVELDVTEAKEKINQHKKNGHEISFTSWLIKVTSQTIKTHEHAAAYLLGKRRLAIFEDVHVSLIVEKELNGSKIPIPLVIEKANEKSIEKITSDIREAKNKPFTSQEILLHKKTKRMERLYFRLPAFIRRYFWRYLLHHPKTAFKKMGNVSITSIGMYGKVNGWFIPLSVHPACFGISAVIKKPVVIEDQIAVREILNMTILLDHDVIDGADMARFISDLALRVEKATGL